MSSLPQYEVFSPAERYKNQPEQLILHTKFTQSMERFLQQSLGELEILFQQEEKFTEQPNPELLHDTETERTLARVDHIVSLSSLGVQMNALRLLIVSIAEDKPADHVKRLFLNYFLQKLQEKYSQLQNDPKAA